MVTNGGYNGVQTALANGVPLVAAGQSEDKPEVCARIDWSGVGIKLKTKTPTPTQIKDAVKKILAEPHYREKAQRLKADIARYDAPTLAATLLEQLAATDVQETIRKHEANGTTQDAEYKQAMEVFNHAYLCRLDPWPICLQQAYAKVGQEFRGAGKIIDWNIEERLGEIRVQTLLLSGRYDEVTPACVETVHQGISGSEWVLFENSFHMPHLEETERFMQVVGEFLSRVEA